MKTLLRCAGAATAGLLALAVLSGCKSETQAALDRAKTQAASTNTPQQVQYVDGNGQTVTTIVQPPATPGGAEPMATTITPPPPGQPKPGPTDPMVTPTAGMPQSSAYSGTGSGTQYAESAPAQGPAQSQGPAQGPVDMSVPAGTELAIRMDQSVSVKHSHAGERFTGEVAAPVVREGVVVIPRGTRVSGRVDEAHRRGHFKGASVLELRLTAMTLNGQNYSLETREHVNSKRGKGKRTAGWIGGLTGVGMIVGGVASGGAGLAIGAASGAGAGTLIAGATGNRDIDIPAESVVHFRLAEELVVQNP